MTMANIGDRQSIELIYPRAVWETEAGMNSERNGETLCGLLIESQPDDKGDFRIRRAARNVGEDHTNGHVVFLCPYMGRTYDTFTPRSAHGAVTEKHDPFGALNDAARQYDDFIDGVIRTARTVVLQHIPGKGERLPKG